MAVFGILFVLGFGLYAVLYAGAASMVSRQEDVNQVVLPLTLLSTAGYMIAAYAGSGLIDLASPLMRAVSFFPLVSPYLILTRLGPAPDHPDRDRPRHRDPHRHDRGVTLVRRAHLPGRRPACTARSPASARWPAPSVPRARSGRGSAARRLGRPGPAGRLLHAPAAPARPARPAKCNSGPDHATASGHARPA